MSYEVSTQGLTENYIHKNVVLSFPQFYNEDEAKKYSQK